MASGTLQMGTFTCLHGPRHVDVSAVTAVYERFRAVCLTQSILLYFLPFPLVFNLLSFLGQISVFINYVGRHRRILW